MRVTKELTAKIDRLFNEKKRTLDSASCKEIDVIKKAKAELMLPLIESLHASPLEPDQLLYHYLASEASVYDTGDDAKIARYVSSSYRTRVPEIDAVQNRVAKEKNAVDFEKENFLIQIAYAGDLAEIKKMFADAGLDF